MSYITEIKINGQLRTLNFNNYGREALARFYGKDTLEIVKALSETWTESLLLLAADCIYWGLVGDYRVNRRSLDFTLQDVTKWLEHEDDAAVAPAISVFLQSIKDRVFVKLPEAKTDETTIEAVQESDEGIDKQEKKISAGKS